MQNPLPDSAGKRYIKQPVVIEAMQWTGNVDEVWDWVTAAYFYGPIPAEGRRAATPARLYVAANNAWLDIEIGEWILKDDLGFYPCKDSMFLKNYAPDDGSGILVIPPGLMDNIRSADYDVTGIRSKKTEVASHARFDLSAPETLIVHVEHTVEITAERTRG
jgi:hypothetical protein